MVHISVHSTCTTTLIVNKYNPFFLFTLRVLAVEHNTRKKMNYLILHVHCIKFSEILLSQRINEKKRKEKKPLTINN